MADAVISGKDRTRKRIIAVFGPVLDCFLPKSTARLFHEDPADWIPRARNFGEF